MINNKLNEYNYNKTKTVLYKHMNRYAEIIGPLDLHSFIKMTRSEKNNLLRNLDYLNKKMTKLRLCDDLQSDYETYVSSYNRKLKYILNI